MTRLPRYTRLSRGGAIKKSSKPMAKRGATKAKREKKYKAFLSSAAWKRIRREALERAGHRCENAVVEWMGSPLRCFESRNLTVHHLSYARFGGAELPTDLRVLCRDCHNALHAREGKRIA